MITSEIMRFLYDPLIGGPPRAFECKLENRKKAKPCGFVSRTLRGMRVHQLRVHSFVPQSELPIVKTEASVGDNASDSQS